MLAFLAQMSAGDLSLVVSAPLCEQLPLSSTFHVGTSSGAGLGQLLWQWFGRWSCHALPKGLGTLVV